MQLFCPACQAAFSGVSRCPRCSGLLLMPHEVAPDAPHRQADASPPPPSPTVAGRVMLGTTLSLGLYLGLCQLMTSLVLATQPDPAEWWMSLPGLATIYAAQAMAVVFGSMIAASGRPAGYALGLTVGAVCGTLFLGYELLTGAPARALVIYLQPPVLALLGLVAGIIGAWVWGPLPAIHVPVAMPSKLSSLHLATESRARRRPTAWPRVLAGAALMVIGVSVADPARLWLQKNSAGILQVQSMGQGEFITWQLATFLVLLGGVVAAAGTGAGIRHGLLAGALGGAGILGVNLKMDGGLRPVEYWLEWVALDGYPLTAFPSILATVGGVVVVALLGGWLGSSLLLPLAPPEMRRRARVGLD